MIRLFPLAAIALAFAEFAPALALPDGDGESVSVAIADSSGSFNVDFQNGSVVAVKVEGETVPDDRLHRDGGRCSVADEHGRTILEIERADDGSIRWNVRKRRVTVGLTMGDVDEALASHLDVEPASAVLVTDVTAGGPAARAGLQRFDVVVAVDGATPVTRESLAEAVASKRHGDRLVLELRRGLTRLPITIVVADEDAALPPNGRVPYLSDLPVLAAFYRTREIPSKLIFDLASRATETEPKAPEDRLTEVLERLGRIEELLKAREPR